MRALVSKVAFSPVSKTSSWLYECPLSSEELERSPSSVVVRGELLGRLECLYFASRWSFGGARTTFLFWIFYTKASFVAYSVQFVGLSCVFPEELVLGPHFFEGFYNELE